MSRFLCTTALEETWREDRPVLFLGEWCRRYSRRDQWSKLDWQVQPYHWDDREKLHTDYRYLQELHERLLHELSTSLNQLHDVDHGSRYWRILIGPWLGYFAQIVFDRWSSIQQSVREHELAGTLILHGQETALVPNDMGDLLRLMVGDEWNHHIYAQILQRHTRVACISQARRVPLESATTARVSYTQQLRRGLGEWVSRAAGMLVRDRDVFLLGTYLPSSEERSLHRRLGQMPQFWRSPPAVRAEAGDSMRRWTLAGESRSEFEACVRALIPTQMPSVYLEGYRALLQQLTQLPWPSRPRLIWTSNAQGSDDVFKAWAAGKVEGGALLAIGQHGGHMGMGRWSFVEDHDIAISDRYLSWGWSEPGQPKVEPACQFKVKRPLGVRHSAQPRALLVTGASPRYSYWMYSAIVARQWLDYFEDQCAFVARLPRSIQDSLTVRLYPGDYGWDQVARWRERLPELRLDAGESSMDELIGQSRIYIATYNATTYLESFTMDVPTVIYWNAAHWELRDTAESYFEDLRRVGIFHATPESAADHVAAVWDDVEAWWGGAAVQEVLERFKERYCRESQDVPGSMEHALRAVMTPGKRNWLSSHDTAQ